MRGAWRAARTALVASTLAACAGWSVPGRIYTDVVRPLDIDMDASRVVVDGDEHVRGAIQHIEYDGVSVAWSSTAIGEIARRHGIGCVHHADLATRSVMGVWTRHTLHIWGTPAK